MGWSKNEVDQMERKAMVATGDEFCPVRSYKLYLSKLNSLCDALWQRPKANFSPHAAVWYDNSPVGKNKLGDKMKEISKKAGLSQNYTKHSIRPTAATHLHHAGLNAQRIVNVTGHNNIESLKHYIEGPNQTQVREASNILNTVGAGGKPKLEVEITIPSSPEIPQDEIPSTSSIGPSASSTGPPVA